MEWSVKGAQLTKVNIILCNYTKIVSLVIIIKIIVFIKCQVNGILL